MTSPVGGGVRKAIRIEAYGNPAGILMGNEPKADGRAAGRPEIPEADRPRLLASRLASVGQSSGKVLFTPNV